jgi:ATP-dependent helicase HrpB
MNELLPISEIRKVIKLALQETNQLIIHAPTGSGKSTLIPQFLVDDVLEQNQSVIVLQPRRIAARLLANYIARERGGEPGNEVGYQVRLESRKNDNTRILFVTEGILLNRLLSHDPLTQIGAIVFDEFHERHLETDLSLALAGKLQSTQRADLKIIVMSATLDLEKVSSMLSNPVNLSSSGRTYPVNITYAQPRPYDAIWEFAASQLEINLPDFNEGSALVFMPGAYEIRKTIDAIQKRPRLSGFETLPLYSSLPPGDQDRALKAGGRKIIVTTNVAETSVTLPNITLVIDSGLARVARFDSKRGINTLFIEAISKSSAGQRTGRAGRVAPGKCIRLWSEFSHEFRQDANTPEIHRLDLSETMLNLMSAGEDPLSFNWIDQPSKIAIDTASRLLHFIGAIGHQGEITSSGREMARLNVHPRLGRILIEAEKYDCLSAACQLVAITQTSGWMSSVSDAELSRERLDKFGHTGSDLLFELNAWLWAGSVQFRAGDCSRYGINAGKARDIGKMAIQLLHKFPGRHAHSLPQDKISYDESVHLRKCIFTGFADFMAIRHRANSPTCQMMHGKSGQLHRDSSVQDARFMVVNETEEVKSASGTQVVLRKVTEIEEEWLSEDFLEDMEKKESFLYDKELKRVVQIVEYSINQLILKREQHEIKNNDIASQVISEAIKEGIIDFAQWDEDVDHFVRRVNFASLHAPQYGIPAIHDEEKDFIIQQCVYKCRSLKDVQKCNIWPALKSWLSYEQFEAVNAVAPEFIILPHKKKPVKLRYDEKGDVVLSETIQMLYDCPLPLTVAEGKVKVIFELLAPSRRPVQVTRDLEQFWKNSYIEIRKELKGRYPKHEWR